MSFLINPFAFAVAGGDFESIATVTVGSGGASSVSFTSISGSYQHLQIRGIGRCNLGGSPGQVQSLFVRLNGVTASNYAVHILGGDGSSASASAASSQTSMTSLGLAATSNGTASVFGGVVIDILDYASTTKATTCRVLTGADYNGSGFVRLVSGLYTGTGAVTSVSLNPDSPFVQHSTYALYGIKA